jgi:two-component sensor histidine kinase
MTQADFGAEGVLHALPEPSMVVATSGRVAFANRTALTRLGSHLNGRDLTELSPGPDAAASVRDYLRRCSGSRSSLLGALELQDAAGAMVRFRGQGCLLEPAVGGAPARVLLRLSEAGDERFSALGQKVRDLNEQIRSQRRTQALLEEALRDRDLMLRELHHRVKNNIHMLAGMLSAARREAAGLDAASVLQEASRRLAAVGVVHQMLYLGDGLRGVRGDEFVARIGATIMDATGGRERFSFEAEPVEIPNDAAVPLALILNELLTNALKHGSRADGTPGRVYVKLLAPNATAELSVEDEGPGFDPARTSGRRASGIGLVRGLTRQIGGSFLVGRGLAGGARCIVRFQNGRGTATTKDLPK